MSNPQDKTLTRKERNEMIRTKPKEFLTRFGNHISNAELDACVLYIAYRGNKQRAPRAGITAVQLIPKRLKEKHWREIIKHSSGELLFNCPTSNIPTEYDALLANHQPTLALNRLADRLDLETLRQLLATDTIGPTNLLKTTKGPHAGYKLAKRIIEHPELEINPEFRKLAFEHIAAIL
jgi:hypothetical protein